MSESPCNQWTDGFVNRIGYQVATRDRHKAPTSTPPFPLSLQDGGIRFLEYTRPSASVGRRRICPYRTGGYASWSTPTTSVSSAASPRCSVRSFRARRAWGDVRHGARV